MRGRPIKIPRGRTNQVIENLSFSEVEETDPHMVNLEYHGLESAQSSEYLKKMMEKKVLMQFWQ